jgi:general secretion pathway protein G
MPPIELPSFRPGTSRRLRGAVAPASAFTLIEMLVVMTLIAMLLTLAVPRYFHSLDIGRATVQRQNAATMRDAIDKFYGDLGRYPDSMDELVAKRYLRSIPVDPISETSDWVVVAPADPTQGNVFDVQPPAQPANTEPHP